jgi:uncharacterized protein YecE (DUF72 family)
MRLNIGQPVTPGAFARYAQHFDLLELRAEPGRIPRLSRLKQWASQAPRGFVFSVAVGSHAVALSDGELAEAELAFAFAAADALKASWCVMRTPASVTPGRLGRERLRALAERLAATGRSVAWDPAGPWAPEQAERFAADLGVTLVRDAARAELPPAKTAYTRLRAFASGGRLRGSAIVRAAERLVGYEEALVVLEGRGASLAAHSLRADVAREVEVVSRRSDPDEAPGLAEADES